MLIVKPGERLTEDFLSRLREVVNEPINPIKYLGIDPGKANGICGYDTKFYLSFMLTINADDMTMFLHQFKRVKKCITEGYKLYPNKIQSQIYSDLETPRVIGRIETWAELNRVELIMQPATVKMTGYKWIGQRPLPKSNKKNHEMDGHVHAMYYFVKNGYVSAADLVRRDHA